MIDGKSMKIRMIAFDVVMEDDLEIMAASITIIASKI